MARRPRLDMAGYHHVVNRGVARSKTLHKHFNDTVSKQERNRAIIEAFKDGYTQSSIANYLNLSTSLICGIVKSEK